MRSSIETLVVNPSVFGSLHPVIGRCVQSLTDMTCRLGIVVTVYVIFQIKREYVFFQSQSVSCVDICEVLVVPGSEVYSEDTVKILH